MRSPDVSHADSKSQPPGSSAPAMQAKRPDPLKPLRWRTAVAWVTWVLAILLLWVQHQTRVLHPYAFLFLALCLVTIWAVVAVFIRGIWRALRGPNRLLALAWVLTALLPLALSSYSAYPMYDRQKRDFTPTLQLKLFAMVGASLMELQAPLEYPHRLETDRLVMSYDDQVVRPDRDIEEMEKHVARLEEMLGSPLRAKIHWVRGCLLGQGLVTLNGGLCLGSNESHHHPEPVIDWNAYADRHELAHAVIGQCYLSDSDPPAILAEGWAESQSGMSSGTLARRALQVRQKGEAPRLTEVFRPERYHRRSWAVNYDIGGAFVDFLLRHYEPRRFLQLYIICKPGTFEADCQRILGADVENLEKEFWQEAEMLGHNGHPKPVIRKLGTIDLLMVETSPVVFKDRLYRFEYVRDNYHANKTGASYFRFIDVATGKPTPAFAKGMHLGCSFVEGNTVYAFGVDKWGGSKITMFRSKDLEKWEDRLALHLPGWGLYNTSVCKADGRYVMAIEVGEPKEVVGVPFTIFFAESKDLLTWKLLPQECVYSKEKYTACPALRYLDGYFYMIYLEARPGPTYESHIVRSKDLRRWESSRLNPMLAFSDSDKAIANPKLTAEQQKAVAQAKNINNSDVDLCEFQGKTVIYYSWGNQQGKEFLAEAGYDGTLAEFLCSFYP
jgi:hypothetical protein